MWTPQMLVQVVFSSNNSLTERELSRSTRVCLTKRNKECPLFSENYVESYQLSRHTNTTLSDHHFPTISFVIINQYFTYGDAKTTIASFFPISRDHYEIPELEDHLDARLELSFSRYSQQKHHDRSISKAPGATQTHSARYWFLRRKWHSGHISNST